MKWPSKKKHHNNNENHQQDLLKKEKKKKKKKSSSSSSSPPSSAFSLSHLFPLSWFNARLKQNSSTSSQPANPKAKPPPSSNLHLSYSPSALDRMLAPRHLSSILGAADNLHFRPPSSPSSYSPDRFPTLAHAIPFSRRPPRRVSTTRTDQPDTLRRRHRRQHRPARPEVAEETLRHLKSSPPPPLLKPIDTNVQRAHQSQANQVTGGRKSFRARPKVRVCSPRPAAAAASRKWSPAAAEEGLESFAVVKSSCDTEKDFRESMAEMIWEKGIGRPEELESLLACYLSLNSDEHHDVIVKVFRQLWFDLNPEAHRRFRLLVL